MEKISKFPKEIRNQINILENTETLILIIVVGILIRFFYLKKQRQLLIESQLCPNENDISNKNGFCIELVSSLLIIYGLIGFYSQSQTITNTSFNNGTLTSDQCIDTILSQIVLIIALIRLYQLFKINSENLSLSTSSEETIL